MNVRRLRSEQGNALVEFALAITVLLTLLFGIIDIGRALYAYDWLYNGARQATRWAMVRGAQCNALLTPPCTYGATGSDIQNYVRNTLPAGYGNGLDTTGIDSGAVTVNSKCFASANPARVPPCAPSGWVQVQVIYQFQFITPFLSNYSWPMSSTSQRVVQGVPTSD